MKALRFYDNRDIRFENIDVPQPGPNEVRIKVTAAGLSQTQINEFIDGPFIINKTPHPLTQRKTPLIPCQEFGGIVDSVGTNVSPSRIGRQVAVLPLISCGTCAHCRVGHPNHCADLAYIGLLGADGGFAEYVVVPEANIFECSQASLLSFVEPLLVGIHARNRLKQIEGQSVLVLGAGAVGCAVAQVLQISDVESVTLTDMLPDRVSRAASIGLNTKSIDELADDYDIVVDAAGLDTHQSACALVDAIQRTRKGGSVLSIGTYFQPVTLVPASFLVKEVDLVSSFMYTYDEVNQLNDVISALPFSFQPLITSIRFEDIIEEGYYRAEVDKTGFTRLEVTMGD